MTVVGAGGIVIKQIDRRKSFGRCYKKLDGTIADRVDEALRKLMMNPMPGGIRFEKLKGYNNPAIYTIHATGNFKISMEVAGNVACLRRVGPHDEIDLAP